MTMNGIMYRLRFLSNHLDLRVPGLFASVDDVRSDQCHSEQSARGLHFHPFFKKKAVVPVSLREILVLLVRCWLG